MKTLAEIKNASLAKIHRHILPECEAWLDWSRLESRQKDETIEGYQNCHNSGFDAGVNATILEANKLKSLLLAIRQKDIESGEPNWIIKKWIEDALEEWREFVGSQK